MKCLLFILAVTQFIVFANSSGFAQTLTFNNASGSPGSPLASRIIVASAVVNTLVAHEVYSELNRFNAVSAITNMENQQQIIQNISDFALQKRMCGKEGADKESKDAVYILNPSLQQSVAWDTSMLPKEHSDTLTSTTTGGILLTRNKYSAGIFASYIYSSMTKRTDSPSRQENNSLSISPIVTYYPINNFYISVTPSIAIRRVDEKYIASETEYFSMEKKRSYTALDTSFTPEVGYTIELNNWISLTPSVSTPFSWTKDEGLYRDYSYSSAISPSLRSCITINKHVSVNVGANYQYAYNRPKSDNLDDDSKPIGRDTWALNAGFQLNLSDQFSVSLTAQHSISDRGWGNNIAAYASYTF